VIAAQAGEGVGTGGPVLSIRLDEPALFITLSAAVLAQHLAEQCLVVERLHDGRGVCEISATPRKTTRLRAAKRRDAAVKERTDLHRAWRRCSLSETIGRAFKQGIVETASSKPGHWHMESDQAEQHDNRVQRDDGHEQDDKNLQSGRDESIRA
jgi:hypothetical protein